MSAERITMYKLRELLRLKFSAKLKHRQIGRALNISPATVSYYTQAARQAGLTWPLPEDLDDAELIKLIEPLAKQLRNQPPKKTLPKWEDIHKELQKKHMTLVLLWEDYSKANPGNHYSYSQFTRYYKAWCKKQKVSMRRKHQAGEKGFIDFAGTTIPVYCRETNVMAFKAEIFVMALGQSHYTFAYACRSQRLPDWIDAHKRAFRYFGGVPEVWVPDNLKAGITDSCQFEPEANRTYADMAQHYNAVIIPARPLTPQDKSIAENAVLVASRWIIARLLKQKFYSLNALNNAIAELLTALNQKSFQKRQGSRYQQFIENEKEALQPLPKHEYEFATLKYQTLTPDYHIYIEGHYYSVPYTFVNEELLCRYTQTIVEVFHGHKRVASHLRSFERDKSTTLDEHMPKAHRNYGNWTPQVFLDWSERTGSGVLLLAEQIVASKRHPELCSKFHFGLKKLCKRFGCDRLNNACRRALTLNCIQFKSIQSILEKGLDKVPYITPVTVNTTPTHINVRGAHYYQQQP